MVGIAVKRIISSKAATKSDDLSADKSAYLESLLCGSRPSTSISQVFSPSDMDGLSLFFDVSATGSIDVVEMAMNSGSSIDAVEESWQDERSRRVQYRLIFEVVSFLTGVIVRLGVNDHVHGKFKCILTITTGG